METQQEIIDKLIDYIDTAILKNSVSNRHVAAVLAFLNEGLKSKNVDIDELAKVFLRRDQPDQTEHLLKLLGGAEIKNGLTVDSVLVKSDLTARQLRSIISTALAEESDHTDVLALDLIEEGDGNEEMLSLALSEEAAPDGATTLGGLTNVDDGADSPYGQSILVAGEDGVWKPEVDVFIPTGIAGDGTEIKTFDDLMGYISKFVPIGVQRNLRIQNNLESRDISASIGEPCLLNFTFISQEKYDVSEPFEDTGERGLCQVSVKNSANADFVVVKQFYIASKFPYIFDCADIIGSGSNQIMLKVTGEITGETTPAFVYTVQLTSLSISAANFKWWSANVDDIIMPLNIGGNVSKLLHVKVVGDSYTRSYEVPLGTNIYIETAYNMLIEHPKATGIFNISAYVSNIEGTIKTKTVSFNVICVTAGSQQKLITINSVLQKAINWSENTLFEYAMYDGDNIITSATFNVYKDKDSVYSSEEDSINVSTKYALSMPLEIDTLDNSDFTIISKIYSGLEELTAPIEFQVDNRLGYSAVSGAKLYINPRTRSNRQGNRTLIINEMTEETITATWKGMNWGNDGWTEDASGNRVLRLMASSSLVINYKPFDKEVARTGKTIEIDYRVDNVTDYTLPVIKMSMPFAGSFIGLNIYADDIVMYSQSLKNKTTQSLHTFEEKRTRFTLTIMPDAYGNPGFNLCILYINGVKNREFTYEDNDYFAHTGNIEIGSNFSDVDIYGIREYEFALTSQGVLNNYINWLADSNEKAVIKAKNDILDANGSEIDFNNVKDQYNVFVYDNTIPILSNQTVRVGTLEVMFYDHPERNVTITNVAAKGQGTSSMKYYLWNTRYQLDKNLSVVTKADGTTSKKVWAMAPFLPAGNKFTAKKNYASSMQSHKIGGVNSYEDLFREVGLLTEAMKTDLHSKSRVSVYQFPFLCFEKSINEEGQDVYTFRGLFTFGPDKGDSNTFGYDTTTFPGLISIEGSDNSPLCTLFRVPWTNRMQYVEDEEAWQYNGANSWDFDGGKESNIDKWIPAYNIVYQCSPRLKPFNGTIEELNLQLNNYKNQPCEFWISKVGDINRYNVYYYEAAENKFIPSDIGSGTINLVDQLIDKGYNLGLSDISGKTDNQLNDLFIAARIAKFRKEAGNHWDIEDSLLFDNNVEFNAGTDERAKNTYPYSFGTVDSKWRWRVDDMDTRFDTTNRGLPDKPYSVETHDLDDAGASVWNGETNNFFNLLELAFPEEKAISMRNMMTAMESLGGLKSGNNLDKIYRFYKKYYFDVAQEYFPANAYNGDARISYENGKLAYIRGTYSNDTDPITQSLGDHYLAEQRWITKRTIYMMSKYSHGLFSAHGDDTITVRAAGNSINYQLTPAMDLYPAIANGTSIIRGRRTKAGEVCEIVVELSGTGDQQNIIQGASYLQDIGEWYDKNVSGSMIIQGRMLREIRLGSKTQPITISISSLTISNAISLQKLILSNISTLGGNLNIAACTHLKEVYADGTSIVQIRLPNGGGLEKVEFSSKNQYLILQNYPLMKNEGINIELCKSIITDFLVVDCPLMKPMKMLETVMNSQLAQGNAHALKRIRAVGFDETYYESAIIDRLSELANGTYQGLDSNGLAGSEPIPVLDGKLTIYANTHEDEAVMLIETFKRMELKIIGKLYKSFKDLNLRKLVATRWGDGEGTTKAQIAAITNIGIYFKNRPEIQYFHEFKDFVNCIAGVEDRAFTGCTGLKEISLPDRYATGSLYGMFNRCINLEVVNLADSCVNLGNLMFEGCTSLKSIKLPTSLNIIGTRCFYEASSLEYLNLPDTYTGLPHAGERFKYCTSLKYIIYGKNLAAIGQTELDGCNSLQYIVINNPIPPTIYYAGLGNNKTFLIYVPDEAVEAYKVATGWNANDVKNRIKPLSTKPQ